MTFIELILIVIYTCVLLIKACSLSTDVCSTFGFGESSEGNSQETHPRTQQLVEGPGAVEKGRFFFGSPL
jgi:hypothetical protein